MAGFEGDPIERQDVMNSLSQCVSWIVSVTDTGAVRIELLGRVNCVGGLVAVAAVSIGFTGNSDGDYGFEVSKTDFEHPLGIVPRVYGYVVNG